MTASTRRGSNRPDRELTPDQERIIERVRKLHAQACSARAIGSIAEAESFAAAVQKTLFLYKLEMSDLDARTLDDREPLGTSALTGTGKRKVEWVELLAGIVAEWNFCRILTFAGVDIIILLGRPADRAAAAYVFARLKRFAELRAATDARTYREATGDSAREYLYGWRLGFIAHIHRRYEADRATLEQEATSTGVGLVRVAEHNVALNEWLAENGIRTEGASLRDVGKLNMRGVADGQSAASQAAIYHRGSISQGAGGSARALNSSHTPRTTST